MSRDNRRTWSSPKSAAIQLGSSGPVRVETNTPDPDFKPRAVGFTAQIDPPPKESEPQLWEGDNA